MALKIKQIAALLLGVGVSAGCSQSPEEAQRTAAPKQEERRSTIWDYFAPDSTEQKTQVNRFIWHASLEVLDFLPIQTIDPYSGVISTGFGTPPGGRRAYRAMIRIDDPALDARSLSVSLFDQSGRAIDPATTRAVEDAILQRARQMRVGQARL